MAPHLILRLPVHGDESSTFSSEGYTTFTAVPEPGTCVLLGIAALILAPGLFRRHGRGV
jgi:hypothetical protein